MKIKTMVQMKFHYIQTILHPPNTANNAPHYDRHHALLGHCQIQDAMPSNGVFLTLLLYHQPMGLVARRHGAEARKRQDCWQRRRPT